MDSKYVVFKREELFQMLGQFLPTGNVDCAPVADRMIKAVNEIALGDAHVIRERDVFAPGVLATYASAVQTAIEVISETGVEVPAHMFQLRDHFFMASNSSAMRPRHLPD